MLYSYSFQNKKRDLSDILSTVVKDEPRFISNFKPVAAATQQKHEWLEDLIAGRSITASAASSAGVLTVNAADQAKVKVGTMLIMDGNSALFRVTAVESLAVTVDMVAANGSTLTDSTIPSAGGVFKIVSTPMAEATDNGDGEQSYGQSGTEYNCCQIVRKDIVLSGSALAINVFGNVDNQLNRQTAFALGELARDLNRMAIFGRRVECSSSVKGEAGGLYAFATQAGGLSVNAAGAMLDSYIINDGAQAILGAGGDPVQILCSPGQARVISNEYKGQLQILRSDDRRGAYVAVIVNEINGRGLTIMADPDMPDTDAFVLDPSGFGLSSLKGRAIIDEDATPKGFDGIKRMALGEITFEFKNALQRLCRITGLKASATALAEYKAGIPRKVTVANSSIPVTGEVEVNNAAAIPVVGSLGAVTIDADPAAAGPTNVGQIVIIGTGWTEGTAIATAVAGELWASNGTAWVKLG